MDMLKLIEAILIYLFELTTPVILGANFGVVLNNKIKIYTTSKYEGKIVSELPVFPVVEKRDIDYEAISILVPLIEKLQSYIDEENLKSLHKNLQTLKVEKNFMLLLSGCGGGYYAIDNIIKYCLRYVLSHELTHLSSSSYDKDSETIFSGFCQVKGKHKFATSLNEGYTELITSRIHNSKPRNYKKQVKIARLLEYFFKDPKEMEALYFNHNLPGLINHLEYYAKKEDIIKFIDDLDIIYYYSQAPANPIPIYESIRAQLTLYEWFVAKDKSLFKSFEFKELLREDIIVAQILDQRNKAKGRCLSKTI